MATTFSCPRRPAGLGHLFFHFSYLGNWPSVASAWPSPLSRPLSQLLCSPSWGPWASQCIPQPPREDGDPQQLFQKEESQAREVQQGRPSHSVSRSLLFQSPGPSEHTPTSRSSHASVRAGVHHLPTTPSTLGACCLSSTLAWLSAAPTSTQMLRSTQTS